MIEELRREFQQRREEARARMMVRVVNRTFKKRPNRFDRFAVRLVEKATTDRP